jgi:hypothetical protein
MTTFDDRERAFEAKFAHDQDMQFRLNAKRDKLFAQWAADRLGLAEPDRVELTHAVLAVPDGPGHDVRLVQRVAARFSDQGRTTPDEEFMAALVRCEASARQQLAADPLWTIGNS